MSAKAAPVPAEPEPLVVRTPPGSTVSQDVVGDAAIEPKPSHQPVLEPLLTSLNPSLGQPDQKVQDTLVIMKDESSGFQNCVQPPPSVKILPLGGVLQKRETVFQCLNADPEELEVFEDLNVFHSQEECVSLDSVQQATSEKQDDNDVGEMMLLTSDGNPESEELQKEPLENADYSERSSYWGILDRSLVSKQPSDYDEKKRLNTSIPQKRMMRSLLVTIENDTPLEELSKFVDVSIIALAQNQRTRRWYTCSLCGEQFNESSYLISHQKTHAQEKPYECTHCGKSFTNKKNLNKHKQTHTGEKPYSCSQCGRNFCHRSHLSRHEEIHVKQKIFKCTECGKTFPRDGDLALHLKSHDGERPYSCKTCGRRFGQLSDCTQHETTHSTCKTRKQKLDQERSDDHTSP